jgi:nucleoid-associated protein YgaU
MSALTLALLVAIAVTGLLMTRHHQHTRTATPPASTSPSFVVNPPSPSNPSQTRSTTSTKPSTVHSTARHVPTPLQYRVKPGDNLWNLAQWFKFNGYQGLYEANWKRLGSDPSLIHPGTIIQISDGAMTVYSCPKALVGVC